ncbi:MAG: hypothetical protein SFZ03_11700 [Candidatus Melainabacteria bacterium]|nr:hypothetical protein [Candidatus Melainabacteria bacterium]
MEKLKDDLNRSKKLSDQFAERLQQHMPDTSDSVLIVLKGHLLIEEIVTESLCLLMHNPEIYLKTNPSFHVKVCLLRALTPFIEILNLDAVLQLNKIRNKLAHHLEYPEIENLMEKYLKNIEDSRITDEHSLDFNFTDKTKPVSERLKLSISYLIGQLGLLAGIVPIMNNILNAYREDEDSKV